MRKEEPHAHTQRSRGSRASLRTWRLKCVENKITQTTKKPATKRTGRNKRRKPPRECWIPPLRLNFKGMGEMWVWFCVWSKTKKDAPCWKLCFLWVGWVVGAVMLLGKAGHRNEDFKKQETTLTRGRSMNNRNPRDHTPQRSAQTRGSAQNKTHIKNNPKKHLVYPICVTFLSFQLFLFLNACNSVVISIFAFLRAPLKRKQKIPPSSFLGF